MVFGKHFSTPGPTVLLQVPTQGPHMSLHAAPRRAHCPPISPLASRKAKTVNLENTFSLDTLFLHLRQDIHFYVRKQREPRKFLTLEMKRFWETVHVLSPGYDLHLAGRDSPENQCCEGAAGGGDLLRGAVPSVGH